MKRLYCFAQNGVSNFEFVIFFIWKQKSHQLRLVQHMLTALVTSLVKQPRMFIRCQELEFVWTTNDCMNCETNYLQSSNPEKCILDYNLDCFLSFILVEDLIPQLSSCGHETILTFSNSWFDITKFRADHIRKTFWEKLMYYKRNSMQEVIER